MNLEVESTGRDDFMDFSVHWFDESKELSTGDMAGNLSIVARDEQRPVINWQLEPGNIIIRDTAWNILSSSGLADSTYIEIHDFNITHNGQYFYLVALFHRHTGVCIPGLTVYPDQAGASEI